MIAVGFVLACFPLVCFASPPTISDPVADLVRALDAREENVREAARSRLQAFGQDVLSELPPLDAIELSERQRSELSVLLRQIRREHLEERIRRPVFSLPPGEKPFREALAFYERHLGQPIECRLSDSNAVVNVEPSEPFWSGLDRLCAQLSGYAAVVDEGTRLRVERGPAPFRSVAQAGVCRLAAGRVRVGKNGRRIVPLEVAVEPGRWLVRLEIDRRRWRAWDEEGRPIAILGAPVTTMPLRRDRFAESCSLVLEEGDEPWARLVGELVVSAPLAVDRFSFVQVSSKSTNERTTVGMRATVGPIEAHSDSLGVPFVLERLDGSGPPPSHLADRLRPTVRIQGPGVDIRVVAKPAAGLAGVRGSGFSATVPVPPGKKILRDLRIEIDAPVGLERVAIPFELRNAALGRSGTSDR